MSFYSGYFVTPSHVIAAGVGLSILDIAFVSFKFLGRTMNRQPLKADDWLLVPATLLTMGIGISMVYGVSKRSLAYPFEIPPEANGDGLLVATEQISLEGKIQWVYTLLLPLALGCTKASFLFYYKRIFASHGAGKTYAFLIGMIVLVLVWGTGFFLMMLFQCRLDFWALWTSPTAILEHCVSDVPTNFALTITDFITDVAILAIPVPLIWRMNLSIKKKIAVSAVFFLGSITVAVSLTRLIMTSQILAVGYDPNADAILLVTSFIYWGMVESGIAIFVACLPSLWIFSKAQSWQPLVRITKNITNSSLSSLRLLRTRGSKENTQAEGSLESGYPRKSSHSHGSDSRSVNAPGKAEIRT